MTTFEMYLFTRVDRLNAIVGVLTGASFLAFAVALVITIMMRAEYSLFSAKEHKFVNMGLLIAAPLFALCSCCWVAIPTQKEMAAILVVPKILSAENVDNLQRIGANGIDIVKIATDYTKEVLKHKTEGCK